MASVADLVEDALRDQAGEYLVRAGEVLRGAGRVQLEEFGPLRVTASVEEGGSRSVVLVARGGTIDVACDCGMASASGWCAHSVAVAIETWHRAPTRQ